MLLVLSFSIGLIFYSYVVFPWLLKVWANRKNFTQAQWQNVDEIEGVSIVMAARNEQAIIGQKIESVYNCGFPVEKIELLVGSDHSDDGTDEIVADLAKKYPGIQLHSYPSRQGKPAILNQLIPKCRYPLVILTDANVIFAEGIIFKLLRHFKDENTGLAGANVLNTGLRADGISEQESLYINRETLIKHREGLLWGTMMGPFGACYAIRRDNFRPFPAGILVDDFYLCMKVLEAEKNAIVELRAICYEDVPNETSIEFRRKVRIGQGNFQNLRYFAQFLTSPRKGLALCFFSHKVLRWITPLLILTALIANVILLRGGIYYQILFALQALALSSPIIDGLFKRAGLNLPPLRLMAHFYMMNAAL